MYSVASRGTRLTGTAEEDDNDDDGFPRELRVAPRAAPVVSSARCGALACEMADGSGQSIKTHWQKKGGKKKEKLCGYRGNAWMPRLSFGPSVRPRCESSPRGTVPAKGGAAVAFEGPSVRFAAHEWLIN